jgi:hypothetical protein
LTVRCAWLAVALIACRSGSRGALPAAGSPSDDGTGQLAQASTRIWLDGAGRDAGRDGDGDSYGGAPYAGLAGTTYGAIGFLPASGPASTVKRPDYAGAEVPDGGMIDGVVRWPRPPAVATTLRIAGCGDTPNPTLRRGGDVEGALVYLVGIARGRPFAGAPTGRSLGVGGLVEKRGCALWPPLQVLAPAPGTVVVGNADPARVTLVGSGAMAFRAELGSGDRRTVPGGLGATRVVDADGALAPAWVVGLAHPYFALSDAEGRFRIDGVPPGTYQLAVWLPAPASTRGGRIVQGPPVEVRRTVTVTAAASTRVAIDLPSR